MTVSVGVSVGAGVGVLVSVAVGVHVAVTVGVNVDVGVNVGVRVAVGVAVGVSVAVAVEVRVAVAVGVSVLVGVIVLAGVSVGVSVKVGVGVCKSQESSALARITAAINNPPLTSMITANPTMSLFIPSPFDACIEGPHPALRYAPSTPSPKIWEKGLGGRAFQPQATPRSIIAKPAH